MKARSSSVFFLLWTSACPQVFYEYELQLVYLPVKFLLVFGYRTLPIVILMKTCIYSVKDKFLCVFFGKKEDVLDDIGCWLYLLECAVI